MDLEASEACVGEMIPISNLPSVIGTKGVRTQRKNTGMA